MKNLCGHHISRLRHLRGWSQTELQLKLKQAALPMSRPAIAKVESGSRCVSDFELVAFASAFAVPVAHLLRRSRAKRGRRPRE
jgi:transcriptional regulator with XRE-family HTH domain